MSSKVHAAAVKFSQPVAYENEGQKRIKVDFDPSERSSASAAMVPYWDKTLAILDGQEGIDRKPETFLPKFPGEDQDDYDFRSAQTKLTNIFRDVCEDLSSKPFEEDVTFPEDNVEQELKDFAEDVDGEGNNLSVFAKETFFNGITCAIDWILIDFPNNDSKPNTMQEYRKLGLRPFWTHVLGINVVRAETEIKDGERHLSLVRILETDENKPTQVREFKREGNVVTWNLYEEEKGQVKGNSEWYLIGTGTMTIDCIPMVPFITGRRMGMNYQILPALKDALNLQCVLYRNECSLEYVKQSAAFPMLSGNGVMPEKETDGKIKKIKVGPQTVLYAPPDGNGNAGSWTFVEPSATSLTFLKEDIKDTKLDLRELLKQPLTAQSGNLTKISSAVSAGKSISAVKSWAHGLKDVLENAMIITSKWLNKPTEEITLNVFTDFDDLLDDENGVSELRNARDNGDLSQVTYWAELKRRRTLSADFDPEKEATLLLEEQPGDEFDDDNSDG